MTDRRRSRHIIEDRTGGLRKRNEYFLMIRVYDWNLLKKTDFIHNLVSDPYVFPPFQHITLYGPFLLRDGIHPGKLCRAIESSCRRSPGFVLTLSGWITMRGRKGLAIAHEVRVTSAFREFYELLWHSLSPLTEPRSWIDRDPLQRRFHITHSYNMKTREAESVCETIRKTIEMDHAGKAGMHEGAGDREPAILMPEHVPFTVLRIALVENGTVRWEFDMPSGSWLPRALAYRRERAAVSLKQYRRISGIELVGHPEPAGPPPFITSDLHLGHKNIIKYCRRPFSSAAEMDEVLISNWNKVVHGSEEVLFLGDLRYGPDAAPSDEYLRKLAGTIAFVRGNHDEDLPEPVQFLERSFGGLDFLFIHNPAQVPPDFRGWTVHGHAHNNNIRDYPFIDFIRRRVNVSTEMTGYRPVSLPTILGYIRGAGGCNRMEIMPIVPPLNAAINPPVKNNR